MSLIVFLQYRSDKSCVCSDYNIYCILFLQIFLMDTHICLISFQDELARAKRKKRREFRNTSVHKQSKTRRSKSRGTDRDTTTTDDETDTDAVAQGQRSKKTKRKPPNSVEDDSSDAQSSSDTQSDKKKQPPNGRQNRRSSRKKAAEETEDRNDEKKFSAAKPPTLQRKKQKKSKTKSSAGSSGYPKSPLYYHLNPSFPLDDEAKGSKENEQPLVGDTPSVVQHSSASGTDDTQQDKSKASGSKPCIKLETPGIMLADTPATFGLKMNALQQGRNAELLLSDVKKKIGSRKMLGSSPLTLQEEVMSVLNTHKNQRIAKVQNSRPKSGLLKQSSFSKSPVAEGSDVFDLDNSSDEFERLLNNPPKYKTKSGNQRTNNVVINLVSAGDSTDDYTSIATRKRQVSATPAAELTAASKPAKRTRGRSKKKSQNQAAGSQRSNRSRTRTRSSDSDPLNDDDSGLNKNKGKSTTRKASKQKPSERKRSSKVVVNSETSSRKLTISRTRQSSESDAESDIHKIIQSRPKLRCTRRNPNRRQRQNVSYSELVAVVEPMKQQGSAKVDQDSEEWCGDETTLTNSKKPGKGAGKSGVAKSKSTGKKTDDKGSSQPKENTSLQAGSDEQTWSAEELSKLKRYVELCILRKGTGNVYEFELFGKL